MQWPTPQWRERCTVRLGDVDAEVSYAGAVPDFVGLDQINVRVPRSLTGRGEVEIALVVDSRAANPVRVSFR